LTNPIARADDERMTHDEAVEQLLRWRLAQAEAEAPPAPRAARLLEAVRPWWETWPDRFRAYAERLGGLQAAYAYAMTEPRRARGGHPIPTVIANASEFETFARVLYFAVRDGKLRLRFQLESTPEPAEQTFEVTFVSDAAARPLLAASATASLGDEYRVDTQLSEELAATWAGLKVTDRMPFRFILRPATSDS
jgi:hypothetical protein